MSEIKTEGTNHRQTLCWDCANATGGCSWSNHWEHTPVKGWNAIQTQLKVHNPTQNEKISTSYIVLECPEFERDAEGYGAHRTGRKIETQHRKEVDREAIISAYQCGVRVREIESATGITDTIIYQVLKEAGIETGKRKTGPKTKATPGWAETATAKKGEQP